MNIFVMILVFILMGGYFLLDGPDQKMTDNKLETAIQNTHIKSILSCMVRTHDEAAALDSAGHITENAVINSDTQPCTKQYNVISAKLCSDGNKQISVCSPERAGRSAQNFIITTADMPDEKYTNDILKILTTDYDASPNFGILIKTTNNSFALLSGNGHRRTIPTSIINAAGLTDGKLLYITQYAVETNTDIGTAAIQSEKTIFCASSQQKVFRFGKWECLDKNPTAVCMGDTIWNSTTEMCEMDPSLRPLCPGDTTAVVVDDRWECITTTAARICPNGVAAMLDYTTMEWVCNAPIAPMAIQLVSTPATKCDNSVIIDGVSVAPTNPCNDCEMMITNPDTCEISCVPDAAKVNDSACYAGGKKCSGAARAFYFGFPADEKYLDNVEKNISKLNATEIIFDTMHSQNRRFNCLDCGLGGRIDTKKSNPPYTAICK